MTTSAPEIQRDASTSPVVVVKPQLDFIERLNGIVVRSGTAWDASWWSQECSAALAAEDFLAFAMKDAARRVVSGGKGRQTEDYDGSKIGLVGHGEWALGAKLCAANGWLSPPGDDAVSRLSNFTHMVAAATQSCTNFVETIPGLATKQENWLWLLLRKAPTREELVLHQALKCLRYPPAAMGCDMAWCMYSYCKLPGGQVGQGRQCRSAFLDEDEVMPHIVRAYRP